VSRVTTALSVAILILLPLSIGLYFLGTNAPRDWSLHWTQPTTVVAATSNGDFATVSTPRGLDVVWETPSGGLRLTRTDSNGRRAAPTIALRGAAASSPQSVTMARLGTSDVIFWRQDTSNQSVLHAAIVSPSGAVRYHTLAASTSPLEHPFAFPANGRVDVVFSWQRGAYDVYLAGIKPDGTAQRPVRLTHVPAYAFNPHAAVDSAHHIQLMYMQSCCEGNAMTMMRARYTLSGREIGTPQTLERLNSVSSGANSSSTPDRWGLDMRVVNGRVMAVWIDDAGLRSAVWGSKGAAPLASTTVLLGAASPVVALASAGGHTTATLIAQTDVASTLTSIELNERGQPLGTPDRVVYEGALDDQPEPAVLGGQPAVVWQAVQNGEVVAIESSRYSPAALPAPTPEEQFGLGVTNPLGALAVLVFGGLGLAVLIAAANVLIILALVLIYIILFRTARGTWKWYAFGITLAAFVYILLVPLDAPSPPVLFLTSFVGAAGVIAIGGACVFAVLLNRLLLRRLEDVYRAAVMSCTALFFLGFVQALVFVQGQLGRI
jgi:hypothetical protein